MKNIGAIVATKLLSEYPTEGLKNYIIGCYITQREGDPPLVSFYEDGTVSFKLKGYVIMPIEDWRNGKTHHSG